MEKSLRISEHSVLARSHVREGFGANGLDLRSQRTSGEIGMIVTAGRFIAQKMMGLILLKTSCNRRSGHSPIN
jgi:hypothetical protein